MTDDFQAQRPIEAAPPARSQDRPGHRDAHAHAAPQPFRYPLEREFAEPDWRRLPGYRDVSFSMIKDSHLRESIRLQLRAEFFNFFNHPNFDLPDIFLGSPTFGLIFSAQNPRRIQFGLKLIF